MSSWSLEHIPAGHPELAITKPIAEWGDVSLQIQFINWGVDTLALTVGGATIATDDPLFGYLDQLVLTRDGVRVFRGWVTGAPVQAEAPAEARTYTAAGASWWLGCYPFDWPFNYYPTDPVESVYWITYALGCAAGYGAPVAYDGDSFANFWAPCPDLRASSTCAEVVARAARLHPLSASWVDYGPDIPVIHGALRAGLAAQNIDVGDFGSSVALTPRPDLRLESVRIRYSYPNPTTGWPDVEVLDSAGTGSDLRGPNRLHVAMTVDDLAAASAAQAYNIADLIHDALKDLIWEGTVALTEAETPLPLLRPGYALSLTGLRSEWETMATVIQAVTYTLTPEAPDTCTITLGAPEHLGPQDYLELARAGGVSGGAAGGNPGPYDQLPPPTEDPGGGDPGTYDDLNGGTGGGTPEGIIAVQARGGMWTLVGHQACDGVVDSPPKRWRQKAYSGATTTRMWNVYPSYPDHPDYYDCGESTLHCTTVYELRGQCMYDRDTGIPKNTLENVLTKTGPNCGSPEGEYHSSNACEDLLPGVNPGPGTLHTTHTAQWYTLSGVCTYSYPVLTGSIVTGEIRVDLSEEDTDEDAVRRMLLTSPAWGTVYTTAIRTIRTTGITGLYREARYRTEHTAGDPAVAYPTLIGLSPWQRYRLTVTLESRPVDSAGAPTGDWAESGTRTHYILADLTGEGGIDWQVVEPTAGYETRIASTLVEVA